MTDRGVPAAYHPLLDPFPEWIRERVGEEAVEDEHLDQARDRVRDPGPGASSVRKPSSDGGLDSVEHRASFRWEESPDARDEGDRRLLGERKPVELVGGQARRPVEDGADRRRAEIEVGRAGVPVANGGERIGIAPSLG